jgi:hypothetical protein
MRVYFVVYMRGPPGGNVNKGFDANRESPVSPVCHIRNIRAMYLNPKLSQSHVSAVTSGACYPLQNQVGD